MTVHSPPRPRFVNPGTNGTVQTVTLGQTTHIDCQIQNLEGYQVYALSKVIEMRGR